MHLHLDLDKDQGTIGARIERALREAIRDGRLKPGARLPSTRDLCVQLGVSRGVVAGAYAQLAAEGYLRTRQGAGTTVAAISTPAQQRGRSHARRALRYDLSPFRPALDGFPRSAWVSALGRACRRATDEQLGYPDPAGLQELREALASYLGRARGVQTTPRQVLITSSLRQGLALVWSVLAAQGAARVAVESPGWRGMRETAADAGLTPVPVQVDEQGLEVASLADGVAEAVAVSPAHQFPTGAAMSAARRAELVAWCARNDAVIVEDDYDAEYRYDRRPVGALQGIAPERTIYGGSASKALAPSMRLGWLALPHPLIAPVAALQGLRGGMPAPLLQLALADLMQRGELDRHLRRQRRIYRRRRDALLQALASRLPELDVGGIAAGLFVVLWLPAGLSAQAVLRAARLRGLALESVGATRPGIVVGYANLSEAAVKHAVELLAQSVQEASSLSLENVAP
jgi:GntR family transcriptional regulator / MocR family aminotransferase